MAKEPHNQNAELEGERDPFRQRVPALRQDASAECLRRLHVDRIVERHQRLERRVRPHAANRADLAAGGVECHERRVRRRPSPRGVEATTIAVDARARVPVG